MSLEFYLDDNLRFIPKDINALKNYISELKEKLNKENSSETSVKLMGEIGYYLKCLGRLDEAQKVLNNALELVEKDNLGLEKKIQNQIRLGHVIQYKKDFLQSNKLFSNIIDSCEKEEVLSHYLSFAYQHGAKNLFDQERWSEALVLFKKALKHRTLEDAPVDQIESTKKAIARVEEIMSSLV